MRRFWVGTVVVLLLAFGVLAGAALVAWPKAGLASADAALARVTLPGFAGRVSAVSVHEPDGAAVPVKLKAGRIWPLRKLPVDERLTVEVTVTRPGWAAWLVGARQVRRFTVRTPVASLRATWLQVGAGGPVTVAFDKPVSIVSLAGKPATGLAHPTRFVHTGLVASGASSAGSIAVAAAPRLWEVLPPPVRVTWFPALPHLQLLSAPSPGAALAPDGRLTLTFSRPVSAVLGSARPELSPSVPGRWQALDAHTLTFTPSGNGFGLGTAVSVVLPQPVVLVGQSGTRLTRSVAWQVPLGSTLRLQQLLAQLGYLPLEWRPAGGAVPTTVHAEVAAALATPAGHFTWRYANTPAPLQALWQAGQSNTITRGAVMTFENDNGLAVDGIAGPVVWKHLIADIVAGRSAHPGYSYVYVHRSLPQSLNLWVDGQTILSSPGNTGIASAPTVAGTFPVFEHVPVGTMAGTNPDGSHYNDPGIRWISYFHGGDAIHAFNRASFGTPQSLGCVELPLAAAAEVYPYTPIGTLVTIED